MSLKKFEDSREMTHSLKMFDETLDEITTGEIKLKKRTIQARDLSSFSEDQKTVLQKISRFSPYRTSTSFFSSKLAQNSMRVAFVRQNLRMLDVNQQASFNDSNEKSNLLLYSHMPALFVVNILVSTIYAIKTQPTMRSVFPKILKGTLFGSLILFGVYRLMKQDLNNQMNGHFNTVIMRLSRETNKLPS